MVFTKSAVTLLPHVISTPFAKSVQCYCRRPHTDYPVVNIEIMSGGMFAFLRDKKIIFMSGLGTLACISTFVK